MCEEHLLCMQEDFSLNAQSAHIQEACHLQMHTYNPSTWGKAQRQKDVWGLPPTCL